MENSKNTMNRNVLLAGHVGFMGRYLTAYMAKEGWQVWDCEEESMTLHNPWAVIYISDGSTDSDLLAVLTEAEKKQCRRFLYITRGLPAQACYEKFILEWAAVRSMGVSVVRLPEVFGQGQAPQEGCIARFLQAMKANAAFEFAGADNVPVPVLYVKDAAYGIFSILQREIAEPRIVLEGQKRFSFTQLVMAANSFGKVPDIRISSQGMDFYQPQDWDTSEAGIYLYQLKQKYNVKEMLQQVYYDLGRDAAAEQQENTEEKEQGFIERFRPYLENIGLFVVVLIISFLQGRTPVNNATGLDICYIYIIIMGIMYGKSQSMPAVLPSMVLLIWGLLNQHGELASIFYLPENIFHLSTYLFLGVFTGYVSDSWRGRLDSLQYKLQHLGQRYGFLREKYEESVAIKDKLYHQIINSDDSIGWLYGIIQQLDTVQVENIFTQAAVITGRIMDTENIAIYVMGQNQYYLRQKVRMGDKTRSLPHSRRVEDSAYIRNILENQHLFVNHGLSLDMPDLAAPIVYEGQAIAIIEIYDMDFEQWNIYQQNLLSVTARLISMAMGKAYKYEAGIQSQRYLENTRIMQEEEFARLQEDIRNRARLQEGVKNILLELSVEGASLQELDTRLNGAIRLEDAVGVMAGRVYILLQDTDEKGFQLVQQRLQQRGIAVKGYRELV